MKLTPILLGISLAATTLGTTLNNPVQATSYQPNESSYATAKTFKPKKYCFIKRFYIQGYVDHHGYYHPGYWAFKKVCKVRH
jgi:hypothetical protein